MKLTYFFVFAILFTLAVPVQAQTQQDTIYLELPSFTWDKTTLRTLIVEPQNVSWWKPEFVNASVNALSNWNEAFTFFASKYPQYAYMSSLKIVFETSKTSASGYDIYVDFVETIQRQGRTVLGLTTTYPKSDGSIDRCTITLAASSQNLPLLDINDMADIAAHEFGHALSLGHSNSSADLMYPAYDALFSSQAISTLDIYGVAVQFGWSGPGNVPSDRNTVALPEDVAFEYAPMSHRLPSAKGDVIAGLESIGAFLKENTVVILLAIGGFCFLIAAVILVRSRNKPTSEKTIRLTRK